MFKKLLSLIAFCCFAVAIYAQNIPKLKMADVVQNFEKKNDSIYIINFWATFCKPCVAEIPNFIKISNKYKKDKVKLLLVSLDLPSYYPKKIADFATKNNFATNIAWLEETNADYFCPMIDKSWGGSIPATIMVNTKTGYKKFFEKELSAVEFEKELKMAMGSSGISKNNLKPGQNNSLKDHSFDPVKEPQ
jgi:thiol-disulfide isomerase/thioredoxin